MKKKEKRGKKEKKVVKVGRTQWQVPARMSSDCLVQHATSAKCVTVFSDGNTLFSHFDTLLSLRLATFVSSTSSTTRRSSEATK